MENLPEVMQVNNDGSIKTFLELKPPVVGQQTVSFHQVYRSSLGRTFRDLYNACYSAANPPEAISAAQSIRSQYVQENVKLIDLRPKRWYRALSDFARRMMALQFEQNVVAKDIAELEISLSGFSVADKYGAKIEDYKKIQAIYTDLLRQREVLARTGADCRIQRSAIIQEIAAAGYVHEVQEGKDLIYALRPMSGDAQNKKPSTPVLKPEELADKTVYEDDVKWASLAEILKSRLLVEHGKMILPSKEALFLMGLEQLSARDKNPEIKLKLDDYQLQITKLATHIQDLEKSRDSATAQAKTDIDNQKKIYAEVDANLNQRIQAWQVLLLEVKTFVLEQLKKSPVFMSFIMAQAAARGVSVDDMLDSFYNTNPRVTHMRDERLRQLGQPSYDAIMVDIGTSQQKRQQNKIAADNLDASSKDTVQKIIDKSNSDIESTKSQQALLQSQLDQYKKAALPQARMAFVENWNNPDNYDGQIDRNLIDETVNPLEVFYNDASKALGYRNITRFHFKNGNFYTESGQSLQEFMALPNLSNKVAVFPCLDESGVPSSELFEAVMGPQKAGPVFAPQFPVIKFVEAHELKISWVGYALGEVTESVNLLPGEKRQIFMQKQTKMTRVANQSRRNSQEEQQHLTSSFEENLHRELSTSLSDFNSQQLDKREKRDQSNQDKSASSNSDDRNDDSSWTASAHASFWGGDLTADASASSKSSRVRKSAQSQSKEMALALSQFEEGQTLNKSTRDIATKDVQSTISKVSRDTSSNNKMEIASSSSVQSENTRTDTEAMQFVNPNMGCTVNFNFHQLQNIYMTGSSLKNVQIVIDTGMCVMEGANMTTRVVCDLEEFNKQFKQLPKTPVMTVLCAYLARQVLKNYAELIKDPSNMGLLKLHVSRWENEVELINAIREIYKKLDLILPNANLALNETLSAVLSDKIKTLELALQQLQKFRFVLNQKPIIHETKYVVNVPAYYVEAQKGQVLATESYLEARRANEIDLGRAQIEHERARAEHEKSKAKESEIRNSENMQRLLMLNRPAGSSASASTDPNASAQESAKPNTGRFGK